MTRAACTVSVVARCTSQFPRGVNVTRELGLALAVLAALFGCGGTKQTPTAPTDTNGGSSVSPSILLPPEDVRVALLDTAHRTAEIRWSASAGAERYVLEYGPNAEGSNRTTVTTDGAVTTFTLRDVPGFLVSLRIRASNDKGLSAPSAQVLFQIPVFNDVIEALFFATGEYGTGLYAAPETPDFFATGRNEAHLGGGVMLGWRQGAIRVRVDQALTDSHFNNLNRVLGQIADATDGYVRADVVERTTDSLEDFEFGQLRVIVRDDLSVACRSNDLALLGCAPQYVIEPRCT